MKPFEPMDRRWTATASHVFQACRKARQAIVSIIMLGVVCICLLPAIAVAADEVDQQAIQPAGADAPHNKKQVNAWWDNSTAGLVGGCGGAFLGVFYGGVLSQFVARGKARTFVVGCYAALLPVGVVCLVAGIVAVMSSQPYAVYYPLLMLGAFCTAASIFGMTVIPRQYAAMELRAMAARDAGPS